MPHKIFYANKQYNKWKLIIIKCIVTYEFNKIFVALVLPVESTKILEN